MKLNEFPTKAVSEQKFANQRIKDNLFDTYCKFCFTGQ